MTRRATSGVCRDNEENTGDSNVEQESDDWLRSTLKGKAERRSPKAPTIGLKQSAVAQSNSLKFPEKFILSCQSMTKKSVLKSECNDYGLRYFIKALSYTAAGGSNHK